MSVTFEEALVGLRDFTATRAAKVLELCRDLKSYEDIKTRIALRETMCEIVDVYNYMLGQVSIPLDKEQKEGPKS